MTAKKPPIIAAAVGTSTPRVGADVRRRMVEEATAKMDREGVRLDSPEARERIEQAVRESRVEIKRHVATGTKQRWRLNKGGRPLGIKRKRNVEMAREYLQRKAETAKSASALMEDIGKRYKLGRSAAITAIKSGLKMVCGKAAKPHD